MRVIPTIAEMRDALDADRAGGASIGLVPTMGALHAGHAALVERAASECDRVAVTVFVNPLQFGAHEDLDAYPRDLEGDVATAERAGAHYVFAPGVAEMYPEAVATTVHVGGLTERFEGASRPGHFDGVATVVAKLFNVAGRCRAYFGEKDWQQLAVVRRMVADLSFPVDVVGCETVREADGLAMSSRNSYLDERERRAATVLSRALAAGCALVAKGERRQSAVEARMAEVVRCEPLAQLDYAAAVDAASLEDIDPLAGDVRLLVAARIGTTRLIDNVGVRAQ